MSLILPKLAIGASWNPDVFDRTGILSLCWGEPAVSPDLVRIGFHDTPVPVFDLRQVADLNAPRRFKRTGYGTKLKFDLEIAYTTSAGNNSANPYGLGLYGREGDDSSLFALASLLGNSTPGLSRSAFQPAPPYLFLTTTYQMFQEFWIPVELDPDDGSPPAVDLAPKTLIRTMSLGLITRQTYRRISTAYLTSTFVRLVSPASMVATLSFPAAGAGPFTGSITFTSALDPAVQIGDAILVWFNNNNGIVGGPYRWERLVMTSIGGGRTSGTVAAATAWPGPIGSPTTVPGVYKIQIQESNSMWRTPAYSLTPYYGIALGPGMLPNADSTQLIGGLI